MRRFFLWFPIILIVILIAFAGVKMFSAHESDEIASDASSSAMSSSVSQASISVYAIYNAQISGKGRTHVLFFADEDPFSEAHNSMLQKLYASGSLKVSVYRADFGTDPALEVRLGVFAPDTFVLRSSSGAVLSTLIHPADKDLRTLILSSHP